MFCLHILHKSTDDGAWTVFANVHLLHIKAATTEKVALDFDRHTHRIAKSVDRGWGTGECPAVVLCLLQNDVRVSFGVLFQA